MLILCRVHAPFITNLLNVQSFFFRNTSYNTDVQIDDDIKHQLFIYEKVCLIFKYVHI